MIELYTWATPNGRKVSVMLEELGLEYNVHEVDISKGKQHEPDFLAISPNNRIPGIIDMDTADGEPLKMFETGAILIYLAEKTGSDLFPTEIRPRTEVLQWLMWQMGGVGPMFGQAHVFMFNPKEEVPQAVERYHKETKRLYKVMNEQLGKARYLANDNFSIADIATFPWVDRYPRHQVDLAEFPNVLRWHTELWERPAVKKGMEVPFYNT